MSDNEIIKALEECGGVGDCKGCSLNDLGGIDKCISTLAQNTLDLINRQKAEVEALINGQEALQKHIAEQKAEIEGLKKENAILSENADTAFQDGLNEVQDLYAKQVESEIKSEAIKEFAERLKDTIKSNSWGFITAKDIDNLVKEMVGEQE